MKKWFLLLTIILCFNLTVLAQTKIADDPTRISVGGRPLGMGKAIVADDGDINSLFNNPAGLSGLKHWQVTSLSGKFLDEVNYLNVGVAIPTARGIFGIGYIGSDLAFATLNTTVEGGRVVTTNESISYSDYDRIILLSYATPTLFDKLSFGTTLKLFSKQLSGTSILNGTASGYDLDIGLLYDVNPALNLGLSAKNILPNTIVWGSGTEEAIPTKVTLGMSLKLLGEDGLRQVGKHKLDLNLDADFHSYSVPMPTLFHLGLEWSPLKFLALRVGMDQDAVGESTGSLTVANNLTAGIGLNFGKFRFDYAYHQFQATPGMNNHFIGISYGIFEEATAKEREEEKAKKTLEEKKAKEKIERERKERELLVLEKKERERVERERVKIEFEKKTKAEAELKRIKEEKREKELEEKIAREKAERERIAKIVKQPGINIFGNIGNVFGNVGKGVGGVLGATGKGLGNIIGGTGNALGSVGSNIGNALGSTGNNVGSAVNDLGKAVGGLLFRERKDVSTEKIERALDRAIGKIIKIEKEPVTLAESFNDLRKIIIGEKPLQELGKVLPQIATSLLILALKIILFLFILLLIMAIFREWEKRVK